jgi:hypothetical protein
MQEKERKGPGLRRGKLVSICRCHDPVSTSGTSPPKIEAEKVHLSGRKLSIFSLKAPFPSFSPFFE